MLAESPSLHEQIFRYCQSVVVHREGSKAIDDLTVSHGLDDRRDTHLR